MLSAHVMDSMYVCYGVCVRMLCMLIFVLRMYVVYARYACKLRMCVCDV